MIETGTEEPEKGKPLSEAQQKDLEAKRLKDMKVKNYLFQAIERPILETIPSKDTSKDIWDSMKKKYQGSDRVKRAQLQVLRREFEILQMKDGESVTSYCGKVMEISNRMQVYGEKMEDVTIVEKILRSLVPKFDFVVCAIKESKDLGSLSLDELQSSLLVHEQKINRSSKVEEQALKAFVNSHSNGYRAVSYTHLTLPTKRIV